MRGRVPSSIPTVLCIRRRMYGSAETGLRMMNSEKESKVAQAGLQNERATHQPPNVNRSVQQECPCILSCFPWAMRRIPPPNELRHSPASFFVCPPQAGF